MKDHYQSPSFYFGLLLTLLLMLAGAGVARAQQNNSQQGQPENKSKEKEQKEKEPKEKKGVVGAVKGVFGGGKKNAKNTEKEQQKAEKQEREFLKLLESARKKYQQQSKEYNEDFKLRVDQHYKDLRRQHSEQAFLVNTFDAQDERITFTGDKLKTDDALYDNPLVQDYVNRVGQSLVPQNSPYRYAFKVVLSPVPEARSLSTGTVYISTGLLSLIDNEAQLAYILAHEIAHTEKKHWFDDALVANELEDINNRRENLRNVASLGLTAASLFAGGFGFGKSLGGTLAGLSLSGIAYGGFSNLMKLAVPDKVFSWDRVQEDAADEYGLKLMFDRNYDPREVPKLYARLQGLSDREPRAAEGFMAHAERIGERLNYFNPLLAGYIVPPNVTMMRGSYNLRALREQSDVGLVSPLEAGKPIGAAEDAEKREKTATGRLANLENLLREKLEKDEIIGSGPEFESVMADLKRDNGVRAFYYDMFQMALINLKESLQIRSNDPYTYFYYGKALNLTARTRAEKAEAMKAFNRAIDLDQRGVIAGPWLHRALALMADRNPSQKDEIINYLRKYVDIYQQEHGGQLPPNMDAIYAYLKDLGDDKWVARPATNVSTKNIEPIETAAGGRMNIRPPEPQPQPQPAQPSTDRNKRKQGKP
jgi:Zn-dependent protease with chaperone function